MSPLLQLLLILLGAVGVLVLLFEILGVRASALHLAGGLGGATLAAFVAGLLAGMLSRHVFGQPAVPAGVTAAVITYPATLALIAWRWHRRSVLEREARAAEAERGGKVT